MVMTGSKENTKNGMMCDRGGGAEEKKRLGREKKFG
jgi:hypothetical protein